MSLRTNAGSVGISGPKRGVGTMGNGDHTGLKRNGGAGTCSTL